MTEFWRLLGHRPRRPDPPARDLRPGRDSRCPGAARCRQSPHQCRHRARPGRGAGRRRCGGREPRPRRGPRPAGRRAHHRQGQPGPGRLGHHQWPPPAEGCHRRARQPGPRQPPQGRRRRHRPHQYAGLLAALVHPQLTAWRDAEPARPRHHPRRLLRRRGRGGRGRHRRPRAWHGYRRLHPLPRLCLRHPWPAPDHRPHPRLEPDRAGPLHRRAAHGRLRTHRTHHRRSPPRPSGHERGRCPRSLVDPGTAGRPGLSEARRLLHRARGHAGRPRRRRRPARCGPASASRRLAGGGSGHPAATGRDGPAPGPALACRNAVAAAARPLRGRAIRMRWPSSATWSGSAPRRTSTTSRTLCSVG